MSLILFSSPRPKGKKRRDEEKKKTEKHRKFLSSLSPFWFSPDENSASIVICLTQSKRKEKKKPKKNIEEQEKTKAKSLAKFQSVSTHFFFFFACGNRVAIDILQIVWRRRKKKPHNDLSLPLITSFIFLETSSMCFHRGVNCNL